MKGQAHHQDQTRQKIEPPDPNIYARLGTPREATTHLKLKNKKSKKTPYGKNERRKGRKERRRRTNYTKNKTAKIPLQMETIMNIPLPQY